MVTVSKRTGGILLGVGIASLLAATVVYLSKEGGGILPPIGKTKYCAKEGKDIPEGEWSSARCDIAPPPPQTKGIFKGFVTPDGVTPLGGVSIGIWDADTYTAGKPFDYEGKTTPDGRFSFELPYDPAKTYKRYEAAFYKECYGPYSTGSTPGWSVPFTLNESNKRIYEKNLTMPPAVIKKTFTTPASYGLSSMSGEWLVPIEGGVSGRGVRLKNAILTVDEVYQHTTETERRYIDITVWGKNGGKVSLYGMDYGMGTPINSSGVGAANVDKSIGRRVLDISPVTDLIVGFTLTSKPAGVLFTKATVTLEYCPVTTLNFQP